MERATAALCAAASRPYLEAGRFPYHYARNKLRFDSIFLTLLRRELIPDNTRLLDLGCGQSLLAAMLLAASRQFATGIWPRGWPSPPTNPILHGIELDDGIAKWGRIALGDNVRIETGDISAAVLPAADVIVLLDVLHYLEANAQLRVLEKIARSLPREGRLLMRVADASAGPAFHLTRLMDRIGTLTRFGHGARWPPLTFRPVAEWTALLRKLDFRVGVEPADGRSPNANILLHARFR